MTPKVAASIRRVRFSGMAILASALGLSACSSAPPALNYTVAVDPTFTMDQVDAVSAALADWKTALPELHFATAIMPCDASMAQQVCVQAAHDPTNPMDNVVGATFPGSAGDATVLIFVDRIDAAGMDVAMLTEQTVAHEMGHVMGLQHSSTGELMAATVPDQAHTVTARDVAQFRAVHGL